MTERELIVWLNSNRTKFHSTKSIAASFGVTTRTIQNYLKPIRAQYGDYIESSAEGIRLKKCIPLGRQTAIPSTYKERKNYILRKLLVGDTSVDMDWLADRLCISEITLQNEIKRIRRSLEKSRLTLKTKNNRLFITGDPEDKKALMIRQIYGEAQGSLVSLTTLGEIFPRYDVRKIRDIILDKLNEQHFYIDEYSLINLLLHILITMDQACSLTGLPAPQPDAEFTQLNRHFVSMVDDICGILEETYGIAFRPDSKYQFTLLLMTRAIRNKELSPADSSSLSISPENMELIQDILKQVNDTYSIDLGDMEFIVAFSLHIQNMLIRLREKIAIHNPLLGSIKVTSPFIYDIAVYISNIIQKKMNVDICEDEIAYIALHVGARIEARNRARGKLRTILVCPQYYSYYNRHFEQLTSSFADDIILESIVTNPEELKGEQVDLVIATIPVDIPLPCVRISNFFSEEDKANISAVIAQIKKNKRHEKIGSILQKIMRRELFFPDVSYPSRDDAIKDMGRRLIDGGFVPEEFMAKLLEREQISPSNFDAIAIPHPIDYYTDESVISVALLEKPVRWGTSDVYIIFMFSVSRQDLAEYSDVFSFLAGICHSEENLKKLRESRTYESFLATLLSLG